MTDVYSVHYNSKGSKNFAIPFKINNNLEVKVWIDNIIQVESKDYYIYLPDNSSYGNVVFFQEVGDLKTTKIVTIEKNILVERKSDFKNFTNFNANILNLELNNFLDILTCLKLGYNNSVQKSKNDSSSLGVIMPNYSKGKGLYWGEEGQILNTDKDINDILNNLANYNFNTVSTNIDANNISIDISNVALKENNLQIFLEHIDLKILNLETSNVKLTDSIDENTSSISSIINTINNTILQKVANLEESIKSLETNTQNINNNLKPYSIVSYPFDDKRKPNYLQKDSNYKLKLVNINKENPLILNFAAKESNILYKADSIDNFTSEYCSMPNANAGRYYIKAELNTNNNKLKVAAYKKRPYFGFSIPNSTILKLHGCKDNSDYFLINDKTFYSGSEGRSKNKPANYIYLGYVDVDNEGNIISDIKYFTENDSFEYFLDVTVKEKYTIPNLIGTNAVYINVYALYENSLVSIGSQTQLYEENKEVGVSCSYNMDEITINTAANAVVGYFSKDKNIYKESVTLKIVVIRAF